MNTVVAFKPVIRMVSEKCKEEDHTAFWDMLLMAIY
jgi:hypothetical protein